MLLNSKYFKPIGTILLKFSYFKTIGTVLLNSKYLNTIGTVLLKFNYFNTIGTVLVNFNYLFNTIGSVPPNFNYFKTIGTTLLKIQLFQDHWNSASKFQLSQHHWNIIHKSTFPGPWWQIMTLPNAHGQFSMSMHSPLWRPYMMKHTLLKPKLPSSSMQLNVALPGALLKARNLGNRSKKWCTSHKTNSLSTL